jgi:hypothetical protein
VSKDKPQAIPVLFDIKRGAGALNVSEATLRSWLSQGKLQRTKIGARTMIAESELARFVAECNNGKPAPKNRESKIDAGPVEQKQK